MHEQYGERVRFQTVYIREAHPLDEWQMDSNEKEDVCYRQPRSLGDRMTIARDFVKRFHYPVPLAVDRMDDPVEKVYAGWPERFYIIDTRGVIVYKGEPGPFGYHPEEVEAWLAKNAPPRVGSLQ
jgi:iodothyronine deiodinase-like protein